MRRNITDPVERIIADALIEKGIVFHVDGSPKNKTGLDFKIPQVNGALFIECKRMHTPRISEQTARAENIIVIQGLSAAETFARWISK